MQRESCLSCELTQSAPLELVLIGRNLIEAYESAQRLEISPWKFAVRWPSLQKNFGECVDDVRWLLTQGLLLYREETFSAPEVPRQFRHSRRKHFTPHSCFVLKEKAVPIFRELLAARAPQLEAYRQGLDRLLKEIPLTIAPLQSAPSPAHSRNQQESVLPTSADLPQQPTWAQAAHQLRVGALVVKIFKRAAANQELILSVFEEEGWPEWIDDPLPPAKGIRPGLRLKETVKSLNRHQENHLIHFSGDFVHGRIRWERSPPDRPPETR